MTAVFVQLRDAVLKDGSNRRLLSDMQCLGTHHSTAGSNRQASGASEQRTGLIGRWRSVSSTTGL